MSYSTERIERAFKNAMHISLSDYEGLVIMSDCHRGCGTWNDNFLNNRPAYTAALRHYYSRNFAYIELGDGDELWENRKFSEIYKTHGEIFKLFTDFARDDRLFLLFGNHDRILEKDGRIEALIIETAGKPLYLLHGYQGDFLNDSLWKFARWLVRYIWKPMEIRGFRNPTSAAKNNNRLKKAEERYIKYSCVNDCILITGHTHRPTVSTDKKCGMYFNSGSCIHPNSITAIEIADNSATLVKWSVCSRADMSLYICREIIGGPVDLT